MTKIIKSNKGFTLIEVLISVSIISLLATVVMYSTSEAKLKGEDAHKKVEADQVTKAIQLYKADNNGRVPGYNVSYSYKGEMVLENDPDLDKKQAYKDVMSELVPKYLPEIPTSPDGESYGYLVADDGDSAVFAAALNFPSSGSSSKSKCNLVNSEVTYSNCQKNAYSCEETEDNACFPADTYSSGCDYADMVLPECFAEAIGDTPQEICDAHWQSYRSSSGDYICSNVLLSTPWQCEKTSSGICTGSSNSDYCSCI